MGSVFLPKNTIKQYPLLAKLDRTESEQMDLQYDFFSNTPDLAPDNTANFASHTKSINTKGNRVRGVCPATGAGP